MNIKHYHIYSLKIFGYGLFMFPVQRNQRKTSHIINAIVHACTCIGSTTKTMFGSKNFLYQNTSFNKRINKMRLLHDRCLITDNTHIFSLQKRQICIHPFSPDFQRCCCLFCFLFYRFYVCNLISRNLAIRIESDCHHT